MISCSTRGSTGARANSHVDLIGRELAAFDDTPNRLRNVRCGHTSVRTRSSPRPSAEPDSQKTISRPERGTLASQNLPVIAI